MNQWEVKAESPLERTENNSEKYGEGFIAYNLQDGTSKSEKQSLQRVLEVWM